jgi:hypothetical protein
MFPTTGSGNYIWLDPDYAGTPAIHAYTNSNSYAGMNFYGDGGFLISNGFNAVGMSGSVQGSVGSGFVYINGYAFQVYAASARLFGQMQIWPIGQTISISQGTNGAIGNGTDALTAGTVVISTAAISSTSQILITPNSTLLGSLYENKSARVPGTSFTVNSTNIVDTCSFTWWIVEIH